jgi:nucleoside-diphosphate-sugar epimerase
MKHTIIVTGSSGYLGSAICVDLARDNRVIGVDTRIPSKALQKAAPNVQWEQADIADVKRLKMAAHIMRTFFRLSAGRAGKIIRKSRLIFRHLWQWYRYMGNIF